MLTGQRVEVTCDPQKVTAGDLFQVIFKKIFLKNLTKKKLYLFSEIDFELVERFLFIKNLIKSINWIISLICISMMKSDGKSWSSMESMNWRECSLMIRDSICFLLLLWITYTASLLFFTNFDCNVFFDSGPFSVKNILINRIWIIVLWIVEYMSNVTVRRPRRGWLFMRPQIPAWTHEKLWHSAKVNRYIWQIHKPWVMQYRAH